jgi:hypothetical protein
MLENGVSLLPAVAGRFPQISGFCFAYDISRPAGSRVLTVVRQSASGACDGGALDLTSAASYSLATNDFVAAGGDGYARPSAQVVNHGSLATLLTTYMSRNGAVIAGFQGRIQCVSSGSTPCPAAPAAPPITGAPASPIRPPSTGDGGLR